MAPGPGLLDRFRLDGKVAVVTGASSGLGVSFASALAEAGADIALAARRAEKLKATAAIVEQHGRRALPVSTDVSQAEECRRLVERCVEELGRIDVLVNNAGIGGAVPALRETDEGLRSVIETNLMGTFWLCQAAAQHMHEGGAIVNISSIMGLTQTPLPQAAYSASKAGVVGLTRDLANQWGARKGIRVNALAPGFFASEMTEPHLEDEGFRQLIGAGVSMRRIGEPEELCAALLFLASPASSYVTGVTLPVDGGWVMP